VAAHAIFNYPYAIILCGPSSFEVITHIDLLHMKAPLLALDRPFRTGYSRAS